MSITIKKTPPDAETGEVLFRAKSFIIWTYFGESGPFAREGFGFEDSYPSEILPEIHFAAFCWEFPLG